MTICKPDRSQIFGNWNDRNYTFNDFTFLVRIMKRDSIDGYFKQCLLSTMSTMISVHTISCTERAQNVCNYIDTTNNAFEWIMQLKWEFIIPPKKNRSLLGNFLGETRTWILLTIPHQIVSMRHRTGDDNTSVTVTMWMKWTLHQATIGTNGGDWTLSLFISWRDAPSLWQEPKKSKKNKVFHDTYGYFNGIRLEANVASRIISTMLHIN